MRIVHLTSVHTWNDIRIFKKMASYLAQEDYEVHLVSLTRTGSTLEVMEVDGVNVHLVPYKSAKNRLLRSVFGARKVICYAGSLMPDVIQCHDPELFLHARLLSRLCNIKILIPRKFHRPS